MQALQKPFSFQIKQLEIVRWSIVVVLTFFISHYLSYGKLPFTEGYQFPTRTFLIVFIYGIIICTANTMIYRKLDGVIDFKQALAKRLVYQFLLVWISTTLIFTFLQVVINLIIFDREITLYGFSFYLLICLFISTFETIGYTTWSFYEIFKKSPDKLLDDRISIKTNGRITKFRFNEISYIHSKGGIVTLVDHNTKRYITQFSAFNEIENKLPKDRFYRVNRQYIINKEIIREVEDQSNRTLLLHLHPDRMNGITQFSVSRYKRSAFKKWFNDS